MDDRIKVNSVEFVVDTHGKVWLNVDGVCVFRAGFTPLLVIDLPSGLTIDESDFGHAAFVFPIGAVNADIE